jgi:hypothetical protein
MEGVVDHPQKYYFRELYNTNPTKEGFPNEFYSSKKLLHANMLG